MGDYTSISAPAGALTVFHEADCSLSLAKGTFTINPSFTYSETSLANNYDGVLHSEAQLTTTPSVFPKGCLSKPSPGFGTQQGVYLGTTTSGVSVFAGIGPVYPSLVQGVYVITYNFGVSLSTFQFSTVGGLTTADLNKDGNGDLVAVDNASASTARVSVFLG